MTTDSKRLTRHEMKEPDALHVSFERALVYARAHVPLLAGLLIGLVVVLVSGVGVASWMGSRERAASEALAQVLELQSRPIGTAAAAKTVAGEPSGPPFADEAARDSAVIKAADGLIAAQGRSGATRGAKLIKARALIHLGKYQEAAQLFGEVAGKSPTDGLSVAASFGEASARSAAGDTDGAVNQLKRLASSGSPFVPKDEALRSAAVLLEQMGSTEAAMKMYQRLSEEVPDSPAAAQARSKVQELAKRVRSAVAPAPSPSAGK